VTAITGRFDIEQRINRTLRSIRMVLALFSARSVSPLARASA
jgi:hypothetical protein